MGRELRLQRRFRHHPDKRFRDLAATAKDASIWVAPPRIFKPGEEWILKQVRSSEADGYLVRKAKAGILAIRRVLKLDPADLF